ncbi:MAG: hypothetical protein F6K58_10495 [Symploca sp. SIO2E9]|nr:hypothetical protein [Symploca sp. SIO2E9]
MPAAQARTVNEAMIVAQGLPPQVQERIKEMANNSLEEGYKTLRLMLEDASKRNVSNMTSVVRSLDRTLELTPNDRDALYGKGLAYLTVYHATGERTIPNEWYPLSSTSNLKPCNSFGYGSVNDKLNEAINCLSNATSGKTYTSSPRVGLGKIYLELGVAFLNDRRYSDSISASQKALNNGTTEESRAYSHIGKAHYEIMLKNMTNGRGFESFKKAKVALEQSIKVAPNQWYPHRWLSALHANAHRYNYPGASSTESEQYANTWKVLYEQSPEGIARREQERLEQERLAAEEEKKRAEQMYQARLRSWKNRPCTFNPSLFAIANYGQCEEGYLDPKMPVGANQPMPEDWDL